MLIEFLSACSHSERYGGIISTSLDISFSTVQGSAIGAVSSVVNLADLTTVTTENQVQKYSDETYVVIPACNFQSRANELEHFSTGVIELAGHVPPNSHSGYTTQFYRGTGRP